MADDVGQDLEQEDGGGHMVPPIAFDLVSEAFRLYDCDGDGHLNMSEMLLIVHSSDLGCFEELCDALGCDPSIGLTPEAFMRLPDDLLDFISPLVQEAACEPLLEELEQYATSIGMDIELDRNFLWIAREGFKAKKSQGCSRDGWYRAKLAQEKSRTQPCGQRPRHLQGDATVSVTLLSGSTQDFHGVSSSDTLHELMLRIDAAFGVPPEQQKFALGSFVVPRLGTGMSLQSLGIVDETHLSMVRVNVPYGVWTGVYECSSMIYDCCLRCADWEWLDDEMRLVRMEFEWTVREDLMSSTPRYVGQVGVEVIEGIFDITQQRFDGHGVRLYLKGNEGPNVRCILGESSAVTTIFSDDSIEWHALPDDVTMIMTRRCEM